MKRRNRTLLAISVILLLLISSFFLSYTVTSDTSNVTKDTQWNDDLDHKLKDIAINTMNYNSNTMKWISVEDSSYKSTKKFKNDTIRYESNINVRFVLEDFHVGLGRFIPLYKYVDYNSKIIYEWSANVSKNKVKSTLKNKGQFEINGLSKIKGFCSASKAKKIIEENIHKKIKDVIQQEIDYQITTVQ